MVSDARERWTVRFGPAAAGPELLALIPPVVPADVGLGRLETLLRRPGGPVRVTGLGVTLRQRWPSWLADVSRPVALTELDAYLPRRKGPVLAALTPQLQAWLDQLLGGVAPGAPAHAAFWSSACQRLFEELHDAWLYAHGLAAAHPTDEIICLEPDWTAYRLLLMRRGQSPTVRGPLARVGLPAQVAGYWVAAAARRLVARVRQRPSLARLATLRCQGDDAAVKLWIGVIGAWPRMSRPVLDTVPELARAAGMRIGVLLIGSLEPGLRQSDFEPGQDGGALPVLDAPQLTGLIGAVDQMLQVEGKLELLRTLAGAARATAAATWRALRHPLSVSDGSRQLEPALDGSSLARLLSIDALSVHEAWRAAGSFTARRKVAGARFVYPHATDCADAVGIQLLHAQGADTLELVHGITDVQYQLGLGMTATRIKAMWTLPEAETVRPFRDGQRCEGGYLPRPRPKPVVRPPLAAAEPISILLTSNYLLAAFGWNPRAFEHYMEPFLAQAVQAQRDGLPITLRWRPHPADDPVRIQACLDAFPQIARSQAGDLDEDLRTCRVLVTSVSAVMMEASLYDVPILVHDVPRWDETLLGSFAAERRFGAGQSLTEALAPLLPLLRAGDERALAPERALRHRLFGASGEPRPLGELVI